MRPGYEKWLEGNGTVLRSRCGIGPFDRLDPFQLAKAMKIEVIYPVEGLGIPPYILQYVLNEGQNTWDGGTLVLQDNTHMVVLNPSRGRARQNATLMEELAHIHLGHPPSKLIRLQGITLRSVKKSVENQAFHLGAAALLPARVLKGARTLGHTAEQLLVKYLISHELLVMRENMVGIKLLRAAG
jgi:Zn-dependent peptidase ImmA (M78 family)